MYIKRNNHDGRVVMADRRVVDRIIRNRSRSAVALVIMVVVLVMVTGW